MRIRVAHTITLFASLAVVAGLAAFPGRSESVSASKPALKPTSHPGARPGANSGTRAGKKKTARKKAPAQTAPPAVALAPSDPYRWLEAVTGKNALSWVARQNGASTKALAGSDEFKAMNAKFLSILDSKDQIPVVNKLGGQYYNFWRDASHPRGLWRRTSLDEYRKDQPAWETVLDLDALGAAEKENWVWKGALSLPPDDTRILISLSRGGADATVTREFDVTTKAFVPGGFTLPEAKSSTAWHDRDAIYVATDFGPGSMTSSGYARIVKLWRRGTPLPAATVVYEAQPDDIGAFPFSNLTPGFERFVVYRSITFYTNEMFLLIDGQPVKLEKPVDAEAAVHGEWLLVQPRTDWNIDGRIWPAGSLLATRLKDFMAGQRDFDPLFAPSERTSLAGYSPTLHSIIVNELDNVKSRIFVLTNKDGKWWRAPMPGLPEFGSIDAAAVDDIHSDDYFVTVRDFLTPASLLFGTAGAGAPVKLKGAPAFFDSSKFEASQHEAVSKDGTKIPYFEVKRKSMTLDGSAPTLLTGYGGFEYSELPFYSGKIGTGWLERGGVLVLANIRGGGEFGPAWHQAAVKENRHHTYEDFIAVAEHLVERNVTSPKHLGCMGGSNGGLLVGNMLTMRPDLFGAIVCEQPLLDMRRYSKLLAGASWMGEYGDPDKPEEWAFIQNFSPYHNLKKETRYPPVLFTSSTRDDRVHPGHARKMVARMHDMKIPALYYENVEGGHAGSADNKQSAFMSALAYQFLWMNLK